MRDEAAHGWGTPGVSVVSQKFVASFAKSNRRSFDSANRKKRGLRRSG